MTTKLLLDRKALEALLPAIDEDVVLELQTKSMQSLKGDIVRKVVEKVQAELHREITNKPHHWGQTKLSEDTKKLIREYVSTTVRSQIDRQFKKLVTDAVRAELPSIMMETLKSRVE